MEDDCPSFVPVDVHPRDGYKFATAIAEILADLATDGATRHPIEMFSSRRFLDAGETA